MDKRNNPLGRNPTVVALLVGLLIGQIATIIGTFVSGGPTSFSGVIPGWPGFVYNVLGAIVCGVTLFGIYRQGLQVSIGRFVSGLIIEQWGKGSLGLIMLVYSFHSASQPGASFPFILTVIGVGCLWRWWDIRSELNEIKKDLQLLQRIQNRGK